MRKLMLIFTLILMATTALAQSKKDVEVIGAYTAPQPKQRYCSANYPQIQGNKAVLYNQYRWETGDVISIKFLESNSVREAKVRYAVETWQQYANLHFEFVTSDDAKIRISFQDAWGSWSMLGNDSINNANQPSMNIGDDDARTPLHEFGHALGLHHEHQSPDANINWCRDIVIAELSVPPNSWSVAKIEINVLNELDPDLVDYSGFDDRSIMMYGFPSTWTTDGYSGPTNSTLSTTDKEFMRSQDRYPFTVHMVKTPNPSCTDGTYDMIGEYRGYPVFQRIADGRPWTIYRRQTSGLWVLDSNDVSESWSGTMDWSDSFRPLPFMNAWQNGSACSGSKILTVSELGNGTDGTYYFYDSYKGFPVYVNPANGYRIYRHRPFGNNNWSVDANSLGEDYNGVLATIYTDTNVVYWSNWSHNVKPELKNQN